MMKFNSFLQIIFSLICILTLSGCDRKNTLRVYEETHLLAQESTETFVHPPIEAPFLDSQKNDSMNMDNLSGDMKKMLKESVADLPLSWSTPKGWIEKPGDGLRLATFNSNDHHPIECTIVSLGGMAGGVQSNIKRWLGQINLNLSDSELSQFISSQESIESQDGLTAQILDFTQLQSNASNSEASMAAAIFNIDNNAVFVKMTGTKEAVKAHLNAFKQLCVSIKKNNG